MKEIILNMKENNNYEIIKKLVEENGNKHRAAIKLNCTIRNINLMIKKYKEHGKAAFSHKNKNRKPSTTIDDEKRKLILTLYKTKYFDFNWQHFKEKLSTCEDIKISYNALYKILTSAGYISELSHRKTRRRKERELERKKKLSIVDKTIIQAGLLLDKKDAHPRKPRAKFMGEVIQMDASGLNWFNGIYSTLHLAVDDSTGEVVGAYFDEQETLKGYYNTLKAILTDYGIPHSFLTDNRTVFIYKHKNNPTAEDDTYTQFAYACKQLGITINTSSVPQKKGRIERLNGSFQRRLPQEMRIAQIKTIEEANAFLKKYVKEYNQRFSLRNNNTISVFENKPEEDVINRTLAIIATRKFDSGSSIKFENKYYVACKGNEANIQPYHKGVGCLVIKTFDGKLYASIDDEICALIEVQQNEKVSKEFDIEEPPKPKKVYIPPLSHPWKKASYNKFLNTMKHHVENRSNV